MRNVWILFSFEVKSQCINFLCSQQVFFFETSVWDFQFLFDIYLITSCNDAFSFTVEKHVSKNYAPTKFFFQHILIELMDFLVNKFFRNLIIYIDN